MSLRILQGTVIAPAAALVQPIKLDILRIRQLGDLWCWVACFIMVLKNSNLQQCNIAQLAFPGRNCCGPKAPCDEAMIPASIKGLWDQLGFHDVASLCRPLTPDEIRIELGAGRPIEAWLGQLEDCAQFTGSGHVVLIVGCQGTASTDMVLTVRDPNPKRDQTETSYLAMLKDDPDYGPWVGTWTNIQ